MTAPTHLLPLVSPGWSPAHQVGDVDPLISDAKNFLRRYSYGKAEGLGTVDTDDTYTEGFGRALAKFKPAVRAMVQAGQRSGPVTDTDSEFDWATKKQMGLLAPAPPAPVDGSKLKPLYVSVEGHMSVWDFGPSVEIGRRMENEGLVTLQGTRYNNTAMPFDSNSGVAEVVRFFLDPVLMPANRKWCISGFSEGDIVVSRFLLRHVINPSGMFHHRLKDMICALEMGAPYRPVDYMGPDGVLLVPDPPKPGTGGISPELMPHGEYLNRVAYLCRHGDLYTENEQNAVGQKKTLVYKVVAESNVADVFMELLAVGINPMGEMAPIIQAVLSGVMFLVNMDAHGGYQLDPATDWVRGMLKAA